MEDWLEDDPPFDRSFDPDSKAWLVDLLFWRPSNLEDEDMQLHFSEWDGKWSKQTKAAIQRFAAKGLDLNDNWALSHRLWACPSCRRSKPEVFRITKEGILLAKLELHHDHLRDTVWRRISERLGSTWLREAGPEAVLLVDQVRELTSRFSYALICSECNSAEAKAKISFRGEIDDRFTFTPSEIGRFVIARPNAQHETDLPRVLEIWKSEKENFFARATLIENLLDLMRVGRLTIDRAGAVGAKSVTAAFDPAPLLLSTFYRDAKYSQRVGLLSDFRREFLARSTSRDSSRLAPVRQKVIVARPTDEEFESYVDPVSSRLWAAADRNWACPICGRGKKEIIRKSKANKWSGGIREYTAYSDELDTRAISNRAQLFPEYPNDKFINGIEPVLVCSDCANVPLRIGQRERSFNRPYLTLEEIRDCLISVKPHTEHEIDYDTAVIRIIDNTPYGPAADAFRDYQSRAVEFAIQYDQWIESRRSKTETIAQLAERVHVFHNINDMEECRRLAEWLVVQGRIYRSDRRITRLRR